METTRFDLKNQALQERIAVALERIAKGIEDLNEEVEGLGSITTITHDLKRVVERGFGQK